MKKKLIAPLSKIINASLPRVFNATWDKESQKICIESPDILCVYDETASYQTYQFVKYIEKVIFEYETNLKISFKKLKTMTAAASLLVFARITKCQLSISQPNSLEVELPEDKDVRRLFTESGLWNGIKSGGVSKVRRLIENNNQYMTGSNHDLEHFGKVISATLINLVQNNVKFNARSTHLFTRGIQEAILNVDYHAYNKTSLANRIETIGDSRWWQCSWYDGDNSQLVFIIYDDGVGIATTLKDQFEDKKDSEIIEEAMKVGTTRTRNPERGKGSNDILKATCTFPNSHLLVMSGSGDYKHDAEGVTTRELPFTLEGTLIQWVLDYSVESIDDNI
mgnify:FL=1